MKGKNKETLLDHLNMILVHNKAGEIVFGKRPVTHVMEREDAFTLVGELPTQYRCRVICGTLSLLGKDVEEVRLGTLLIMKMNGVYELFGVLEKQIMSAEVDEESGGIMFLTALIVLGEISDADLP